MGGSLGQTTDRLVTHFIVICLFLALFILTWIGVGNIVIVSMLGFLLCIVGLAQGQAQVDLWVLVPLMLYNLLSMASSYAEYGNVTDGYASTQMIYPAIYLVLSYADDYERKRRDSWPEMLRYAYWILAKDVLGVGVGLLMYLAGTRTDAPWVCVLLLLYLLVLAACWRRLESFLEIYVWVAAGIALSGAAVTAAAIMLRPSSYATFAERLEMMRSALKYLTANPLLGVGPYRWRFLDMYDGGTYYNTWHIHNVLLHVGVELGLAAMIMLTAVAVRFLCKKKDPAVKAGFAAFFLHNMMDTGFFYLGITAMVLLAVGNPRSGGKTVRAGIMRVMFGGLAVFFTYNLYYYITA